MKLADYLDLLAHDAAFAMAAVRDPETPVAALGAPTMEVCGKLRAAAIIVLLTKADTDAWCHNLIRSALARREYLRRLHAAGIADDHHQAAGRHGPLVDALAAGDLALAAQVAALERTAFLPGHEYEDDFRYAVALRALIPPLPNAPALAAAARGLRAVAVPATAVRALVLEAIASGDGAAFADAFEALLDQRANEIEAARARGQLEEPDVVAERQVFVEGIALLRAAERRGIALDDEYRYCPSLARRPMTAPFPGE